MISYLEKHQQEDTGTCEENCSEFPPNSHLKQMTVLERLSSWMSVRVSEAVRLLGCLCAYVHAWSTRV